MKSLILVFLFLSHQRLTAAEPASGPEPPINRTLGIKLPGKVNFVTWSLQKSACIVQLVLPSVRDGEPLPPAPATQVWLLRSDGTTIPQTAKPSAPAIGMTGSVTKSVLYVFPVSAAAEAVAVVIAIDGTFLVERLPSKPQ